MPTILLTAFEPFAGANVNPSARVAEVLARETIPGARLVTATLPVVAARIPGIFASLLEQHRPDAILSLGEARGSPHIRVERRAVNRLHFTGDNSGAVAVDQPVVPGGPSEYRSTLGEIVDKAIRFLGIPCELSDSAGTFCCNQILYLSLRHGVRNQPRLLAGFVHLPSLPEQRVSGMPVNCNLPLQSQVTAIREALRTAAHLCTGF